MVMMFLLLVPVLAVTSYFRLTDHAAAMRKCLADSLPNRWNETVELNIGPWTTRFLRTGLSFLDLPTEARSAASALNEIQFGVYKLAQGKGACDISQFLEITDDAMNQRGLTRLLGVLHRRHGVAVYVSDGGCDQHRMEASILIVDQRQIILGSGRLELDKLTPLLTEKLNHEWRRRGRIDRSSLAL
jgi:hypothetical protein